MARTPASVVATDDAAAAASMPGRLTAPEAAVVISLIAAVTVLTLAHRPLPTVLLALCAGASALLPARAFVAGERNRL